MAVSGILWRAQDAAGLGARATCFRASGPLPGTPFIVHLSACYQLEMRHALHIANLCSAALPPNGGMNGVVKTCFAAGDGAVLVWGNLAAASGTCSMFIFGQIPTTVGILDPVHVDSHGAGHGGKGYGVEIAPRTNVGMLTPLNSIPAIGTGGGLEAGAGKACLKKSSHPHQAADDTTHAWSKSIHSQSWSPKLRDEKDDMPMRTVKGRLSIPQPPEDDDGRPSFGFLLHGGRCLDRLQPLRRPHAGQQTVITCNNKNSNI